jgi:Uma2 family endonuclease
MSAAHKLPELLTVDAFLALPGDKHGRRMELIDGVVRLQDAPSDAHGRIHANIVGELTFHLKQKRMPCSVVIGGGVRPHLRSNWNFRVPDLAVTCAKNKAGVTTVPDPVILIEVLSPSNAAKTWDNVRNYATIPSVQEIVLFESTRIEAHILTRDASGHWPENPVLVKAGGIVPFTAVDFDMPIEDAYRNTYLSPQV